MEDLIKAVRAHALAHYEEDGWDYVVECYEDADLQQLIEEEGATTAEEAIKALGKVMKLKDDYRKDIQGTAF